MRSVPRVALAVAMLALGSACYAETSTTVPSSASVSVGYVPAYYDGYPVFYDGFGNPYYYSGGVAVWIAPSSAYYAGLVHHYHVYGPAYRSWYGSYGYRYHGYRAAPGYYGYGHPPATYHGGGYHGGGAYHGGGGYHGGAYHGGGGHGGHH